ncbi:MAG: hypothetical protein ACLQCU_01185 [Acidimicrobiales bacterium]
MAGGERDLAKRNRDRDKCSRLKADKPIKYLVSHIDYTSNPTNCENKHPSMPALTDTTATGGGAAVRTSAAADG